MEMNKKMIRKLILEAMEEMLSAEDETDKTRLGLDSVDDQIDSFLIKFEKDSISPEGALSETRVRSLVDLLFEQEEGEEEPDEEEEPEVPEPEDSTKIDATEPAEEIQALPLNIDAFTKRVARLVMNNAVLLDVRSVILNRAKNYLLENYDQAHVNQMREILDTQFDFNLEGAEDTPDAPYAVGAYAGGTGGLGGGGG